MTASCPSPRLTENAYSSRSCASGGVSANPSNRGRPGNGKGRVRGGLLVRIVIYPFALAASPQKISPSHFWGSSICGSPSTLSFSISITPSALSAPSARQLSPGLRHSSPSSSSWSRLWFFCHLCLQNALCPPRSCSPLPQQLKPSQQL